MTLIPSQTPTAVPSLQPNIIAPTKVCLYIHFTCNTIYDDIYINNNIIHNDHYVYDGQDNSYTRLYYNDNSKWIIDSRNINENNYIVSSSENSQNYPNDNSSWYQN